MASKSLTVDEVVDIVIGVLAEDASVPADQMRTQLEAAGPELPADSVLVAAVLARVEVACGARVPADAEAARSMGSVMEFARTVHRAIPAGGEAA